MWEEVSVAILMHDLILRMSGGSKYSVGAVNIRISSNGLGKGRTENLEVGNYGGRMLNAQ